jgi:hypothetical protein
MKNIILFWANITYFRILIRFYLIVACAIESAFNNSIIKFFFIKKNNGVKILVIVKRKLKLVDDISFMNLKRINDYCGEQSLNILFPLCFTPSLFFVSLFTNNNTFIAKLELNIVQCSRLICISRETLHASVEVMSFVCIWIMAESADTWNKNTFRKHIREWILEIIYGKGMF